MIDLEIYVIKQNNAKVKAGKYGQFSKTSGWNFFWDIFESVIDRVPLFQ